MPDPQRILIIKPSAIGDVVHALPVLNLLRNRWPAAAIDWLVTPPCAGLLEEHPQLNQVILFNRPRFGQGWRNPRAAWDFLKWTLRLRRRRYDLVIDLQGLFRSGWIAWTSGAPRRTGFANARELGWLFYTDRVRLDSVEQHAVERYVKLAQSLGCPAEPVEFRFATTDADRRAVADLLENVGVHMDFGIEPTKGSGFRVQGSMGPGTVLNPEPRTLNPKTPKSVDRPPRVKRFAVLLPGTNWTTKRWPIAHFAALVEPLQQKFGLQTVVAGGPGDTELARQIPGAINLAGQTSLSQLAALLERAELVIANDSGPMHIAAALGRPLVTLFGPTNPVRTGPFNRPDTVLRLDIPCSPCYSRKCSHQSCLQWLTPAAVLEAARQQLSKQADLPLDNPAVSWDGH